MYSNVLESKGQLRPKKKRINKGVFFLLFNRLLTHDPWARYALSRYTNELKFKYRISLNETLKILLKHYLVGSFITGLIFWFLNEIPDFNYFKLHLTAFVSSVVSIPLIGLLISKVLNQYLVDNGFRVYFLSFLSIFITWVLLLYTKALVVGIVLTFKTGEFEIIQLLIGYSIYQLWIYAGIGLIHGVFGGIFLGMELKRNLKQKTQVTLV